MPQFNSATAVVADFPEEWYPMIDESGPEDFLNGAILGQLIRAINFKENQLAPNTAKPFALLKVLPTDNALGDLTNYGTFKFPINYSVYIISEAIRRVAGYCNDSNSGMLSPSLRGIDANGDGWSFTNTSRNNINTLTNKGYYTFYNNYNATNRLYWYEIITLLRLCIQDLKLKWCPMWNNGVFGRLVVDPYVKTYPYINCVDAQNPGSWSISDTTEGNRNFVYNSLDDKYSGNIHYNVCNAIDPWEKAYRVDNGGNVSYSYLNSLFTKSSQLSGTLVGMAGYRYQYYLGDYYPYRVVMVPPDDNITYTATNQLDNAGCHAKAYYSDPYGSNNNYILASEVGFYRLGGMREEYNYKFEIYSIGGITPGGTKLTNWKLSTPISIGIDTVRYASPYDYYNKGEISIVETGKVANITNYSSRGWKYTRDILLTDDNIAGKSPWKGYAPVYPDTSHAATDYGCQITVVANLFINGLQQYYNIQDRFTPVDICNGNGSSLNIIQFSMDFNGKLYIYKTLARGI